MHRALRLMARNASNCKVDHAFRKLTERLKVDLRAESWRYQFLLAYYRDVRDATEAAADALSGKAPLSNEELLINAYRATQYKQGASTRATYDDLRTKYGFRIVSYKVDSDTQELSDDEDVDVIVTLGPPGE